MSCMVCTEPLYAKADSVSAAQCGHTLHQSCWTSSLSRTQWCPVCRKPTSSPQLLRLFLNADDDDAIILYNKTIDTLHSQISALKQEKKAAEDALEQENKAAEENVKSKEKEIAFLRAQLEKNKSRARTVQKSLDSVRKQLHRERNERKDTTWFMKQVQSQLLKDQENKKQDVRQILGVSKKEADKLRSQILDLKMGPTTTGLNFEAHKFQRAIEALDERMNSLNQRLQR